VLARDADDNEVELVVDLVERPVPAHRAHRLAAPVDRVRGAAEAACEHIAEELAADRSSARRCSDDGHGAWLEERSQRGDDADVVALVDALPVAHGRFDRKPDLDDAGVERSRRREADVLEHGEHCGVPRQHLRDERLDAALRGAFGQLLEQPRPDSLALPFVGDREGRLRRRALAQPHVVADRDDRLGVGPADHADERASLVPVRLDERPHELLVRPRQAVEAEKAARGREVVEEGAEALHVRRGRGPEPERRSVTEDDVDPGSHPCIVTFRWWACDYTRGYTRRGMDHSIEGRDNARHDENDHRTRHSADRAAAGSRRTDRGRVLE
jgi:hypothetical protein